MGFTGLGRFNSDYLGVSRYLIALRFQKGVLSSFFSDTFVSSYTCGSAIHVLASQLKDLFGIKNVTKYEGIFKIPKVSLKFFIIMFLNYSLI